MVSDLFEVSTDLSEEEEQFFDELIEKFFAESMNGDVEELMEKEISVFYVVEDVSVNMVYEEPTGIDIRVGEKEIEVRW